MAGKRSSTKKKGSRAERSGSKGSETRSLATEEEVLEVLREHYPVGIAPETVVYYLDEGWRRNLEARARAEAGARFLEDLVVAVESRTGLDVLERADLVQRPAWLLKILLHPGKRFREPVLTDSVLADLGGEARVLDVWISALGPFYYARGYRVWPDFKEELEGSPPPLSREDPTALKAMRVAARALRQRGFRRVPGDVARREVPELRTPGSLPGTPATVFELLFEGASAAPVPVPPEPARPRARPRREGARPPPVDDGAELEAEVDVEMELFQRELEEELDKIRDEIEEARRRRR